MIADRDLLTVSQFYSINAEIIARQMNDRYLALTGIEPLLFVTRPAAGAHLV